MTVSLYVCHPAHLIINSDEIAKRLIENVEESELPLDILEEVEQAEKAVVLEREEALAEKLAEMKKCKKKLVDPLQFEMSIQAEDLSNHVLSFG